MNSVHQILKQLYKRPVITQAGKQYVIFPTSVSMKEGDFLAFIIDKVKPDWVIEIGLGFGVSPLWINSGVFHPKRHTVIEPNQGDWGNIGKRFLKQAKLKNIDITEMSSQEYLASILQNARETVDMIIIDGDERFDGVTTDIFFATKLLRIGGVLVVRNVWNPSVRKSLMFYIKNLPYKTHALENIHHRLVQTLLFGEPYFRFLCNKYYQGFCVLQKTGVDVRPWDHFINF